MQQALFREMRRIGRIGMGMVQMEGELTKMGLICLVILEEHQRRNPDRAGMYVWEMAARMRVSPPAVSRMLRGLEAKGQIVRSVDRLDRRNILVALSPKGQAVCTQAKQMVQSKMDYLVQQMGAEQVRTLVRLLGQLNDLLEEPTQGSVEC